MGETLRRLGIDPSARGSSQQRARWPGQLPGPCLLLGIAALAALPSCDSNAFVPARPPELITAPPSVATNPGKGASSSVPTTPRPGAEALAKTTAIPTARARLVELIQARPTDLDHIYFEQILRRETGARRCAFRVANMIDDKPLSPEQVASEIRTAANRSTGALILEPVDVPDIREALHEAEAKGLKIVLLDSPLPSSSPGKPYPVVTYKGFAGAAKQLVESMASDVKTMQLPADGTTLVVENREKDFYSRDRLESITGALKAAGRTFDTVSFNGDQKEATQVVLDYLKTHPQLTVVLADQDLGVAGAYDARDQWIKTHTSTFFAVGGYYACDARLILPMKARVQGLIDRNVEAYARRALEVALDLMDGKAVPERVLVDVRFHPNPHPYLPTSAERTQPKKAAEPRP